MIFHGYATVYQKVHSELMNHENIQFPMINSPEIEGTRFFRPLDQSGGSTFSDRHRGEELLTRYGHGTMSYLTCDFLVGL